ncbi:MAG: hypothetical protein B7Y42_00010 [Polaromonas sp. 28-63-22]|nr:MAG: hypothetical protein B7Y42_00010 [Polaromonas sp. 28-63-22]
MASTRSSPAGPAADPAASVCTRCGAVFRCGMVAGDAHCWCADLPALPQLPVPLPGSDSANAQEPAGDASCFCPACLKSLTTP